MQHLAPFKLLAKNVVKILLTSASGSPPLVTTIPRFLSTQKPSQHSRWHSKSGMAIMRLQNPHARYTLCLCVCRYNVLALTKSFFQPTLASDRITPTGGLGNWLHLEGLQSGLGNWLHLEDQARQLITPGGGPSTKQGGLGNWSTWICGEVSKISGLWFGPVNFPWLKHFGS